MSTTKWHTIRPWAPSLSLSVIEVTSVSATFLLSQGQIDDRLASRGLEAADEENPDDALQILKENPRKHCSLVADVLAKGLSVNVNGAPWQRAFIRTNDRQDEAVIIIHALQPGRHYDIELALPTSTHPSTIKQLSTADDDSEDDTPEGQDSSTTDTSTSSSNPHSTPSTSPSRTVPGTPPIVVAPQITLEEKLNQLQLTLASISTERDDLLASLKSSRKDSQKADAALRSEIDTLKRTSEKNAAAEARGRQKVLALQEAVKRANNATKETELKIQEMEKQLPELKAMELEKEKEHEKIKLEAQRIRKLREEVEEKERKRMEVLKTELASLATKLEKLSGKREKLETTLIPELEEQLKDVEKEIAVEHQEIARMEMEDSVKLAALRAQKEAPNTMVVNGDHHSPTDEQHLSPHPSAGLVPFPQQRMRNHSTSERPSPISRPTPAPIQRPLHPLPDPVLSPSYSNNNSIIGGNSTFHLQTLTNSIQAQNHQSNNRLWTPPSTASARQLQHQRHPSHHQVQTPITHNPRSHSFHNHSHHHSSGQSPPVVTILNRPRQTSLMSNPYPSPMPSPVAPSAFPAFPNSGSSISGSSSPANSSPMTSSPVRSSAVSAVPPTAPPIASANTTSTNSTLSSRAPPFEPLRSNGHATGKIHGPGHTRGHTLSHSVSVFHGPMGVSGETNSRAKTNGVDTASCAGAPSPSLGAGQSRTTKAAAKNFGGTITLGLNAHGQGQGLHPPIHAKGSTL